MSELSAKGKTPAIRFKGFSGKWEEKDLGNNAEFSKGQGYSKSDLVDSGCPIILYGRLYTNYETTISQVDTYALVNEKSILSKGSEVVVPASGETAEDIARASAVVSNGIILGGDLNIIYPNSKIASIFLALYISNGRTQKELSKKAQGKSVVHVRNDDLKQLSIYSPKEKEQTQIGNFFQQLDRLIAQHQQKHDKLRCVKKALLTKMFPKQGETQPAIRFKGFSEAWEEKTLGDVSKIKTGSSNREDSGLDGKYTFFDRSEDIRTSNIFLFDCEAVIVAGEGSDFIPKYFVGKFDLHQRTYAVMNFIGCDGKYLF